MNVGSMFPGPKAHNVSGGRQEGGLLCLTAVCAAASNGPTGRIFPLPQLTTMPRCVSFCVAHLGPIQVRVAVVVEAELSMFVVFLTLHITCTWCGVAAVCVVWRGFGQAMVPAAAWGPKSAVRQQAAMCGTRESVDAAATKGMVRRRSPSVV